MSTYKGKALGTIGDFGCFSFHETKNYSMGEGGALLIKDPKYNEKAEILREKGLAAQVKKAGRIVWDAGRAVFISFLSSCFCAFF